MAILSSILFRLRLVGGCRGRLKDAGVMVSGLASCTPAFTIFRSILRTAPLSEENGVDNASQKERVIVPNKPVVYLLTPVKKGIA